MGSWLRRIAFVLALAFLVLTFVNASWIAPKPRGYPHLLALRGLGQQPVSAEAQEGACPAAAIETPVHDYIENSLPALQRASGMGAAMILVDINLSQDGRIVLFRDKTLDCRTGGKGEVGAMSLAQLKALDAGYGYSADGGKSFPLRGTGVGFIPTLDEAVRALPTQPMLYNLSGKDAAAAKVLVDELIAANRNVEAVGDAFLGDEATLAPIRSRIPKAWAFSYENAQACTSAYRLQGWLGLTPAACKGGTIMIPLDRQWMFAGWPNRLMARMTEVGARVILAGPSSQGAEPRGLDLPEQIGEVPASFTGHVWIADQWVIGPSLHPSSDRRNGREIAETEALIVKRRENR